jgi:hypothetical protein
MREAGCGDSAHIAEPENADRCTHPDALSLISCNP